MLDKHIGFCNGLACTTLSPGRENLTPPTVLVVDDEPLNLSLLAQLLNPNYRVLVARSGPNALALLATEQPDLVLLDVMMPGMDGYAVLAHMQRMPQAQDIPVIFVTALDGEADEERGLALGAKDYVTKPIKPNVLLARVRAHLELKQTQDRLRHQNQWLEAEVQRRTRESLIAQDLTLSTLAELAETRDNETGHHIQRTQGYVEVLALHLQSHPELGRELDDAQLQRIVKAAPLHDIGKIGIRDHVLLKPGALTPEEFEEMKTHARIGGDALAHAMAKATPLQGGDSAEPPEALRFLEVARTIATHHHERWDGTGYPDRLAGQQIPLPARLMAVADVFDALIMRRIYKPAWPVPKAMAHIESQAGQHFDPAVVAAFLACRTPLAEIAARLAD
jgi:putative two-component system response regulator